MTRRKLNLKGVVGCFALLLSALMTLNCRVQETEKDGGLDFRPIVESLKQDGYDSLVIILSNPESGATTLLFDNKLNETSPAALFDLPAGYKDTFEVEIKAFRSNDKENHFLKTYSVSGPQIAATPGKEVVTETPIVPGPDTTQTQNPGVDTTKTPGPGPDNVKTNTAPIALPQSLSGERDKALSITLEAEDPDGDALTWKIESGPHHGQLTGTAPELTYTPNPNFKGRDSLTYSVSDGKGGKAEATVTLIIDGSNRKPIANSQTLEMLEDESLEITLTGSDPDGDSLTWILVSPPKNGTLTGDGPLVNYKPEANFFGKDSLVLKANDGELDSDPATVRITVKPVNDPPVLGPLTNKQVDEGQKLEFTVTASDPDGETPSLTATNIPQGASFLDGVFSWTPDFGQAGSYSITFAAKDAAGLTDEKTISITVGKVDRPPVFTVVPKDSEVELGTIYTSLIQANDPDGDPVSISLKIAPKGMTITDGKIQWLADRNQFKPFSEIQIQAQVASGQLFSDTSWTLSISPRIWRQVTKINSIHFGDTLHNRQNNIVATTKNILYRIQRVGPGYLEQINLLSSNPSWVRTTLSLGSDLSSRTEIEIRGSKFLANFNGQGGLFDIPTNRLDTTFHANARLWQVRAENEIYSAVSGANQGGCGSALWFNKTQVWQSSTECIRWINLKILPDVTGIFALSNPIIGQSSVQFRYSRTTLNALIDNWVAIPSGISKLELDNGEGNTAYLLDPNLSNLYRVDGASTLPQIKRLPNAESMQPKEIRMYSGTSGWILNASGDCFFTNDGFETTPTKEIVEGGGKFEELFFAIDGSAEFAVGRDVGTGEKIIYRY